MSQVLKLGITSNNNKKIEEVDTIEVLTNKGVVGDRHFNDYNDPYLYLLPNFQQSIDNYIYKDDDGNSDIEEGLFFYLADITFTNNMIALVTSYDPEVKGTVDFNITSDNQLMIIPEPAAISLLFTAGILLIVLRKNKRLV